MDEWTVFLVYCFNKEVYRKLKAAFNNITIATIIILSHYAQNLLTANDHHTVTAYNNTHDYKYFHERIFPLTNDD
jgi:hypothetical protein